LRAETGGRNLSHSGFLQMRFKPSYLARCEGFLFAAYFFIDFFKIE